MLFVHLSFNKAKSKSITWQQTVYNTNLSIASIPEDRVQRPGLASHYATSSTKWDKKRPLNCILNPLKNEVNLDSIQKFNSRLKENITCLHYKDQLANAG
jgi:hypothetical protein